MIVDSQIGRLCISCRGSIKEALARINATTHLVQVVVDETNRIQGIVTDGDIRRALVSGAGLDSPVSECMQRSPVTARSAEDAIAILPDMGGRHPCVPVVDESGHFLSLVSESNETPGLETAVVMAGGFGKRLGDKTKSTPKPLIEVGGRPILWHILKDLQEHGVKRIFVSVHYLAEQICEFVDAVGLNVKIDILREETPLGTAGALSLIPEDVEGPLLIMNGDIVTRANFAALMIHHQLNQRDATIGAARYDQEVPFGVLEIDSNGNVSEIKEKPRYEHYISAGIYAIQPSIYRSLNKREHIDMPDLLRRSILNKQSVGLFPIHEYWLDLGRPNDLKLAESQSDSWMNK